MQQNTCALKIINMIRYENDFSLEFLHHVARNIRQSYPPSIPFSCFASFRTTESVESTSGGMFFEFLTLSAFKLLFLPA